MKETSIEEVLDLFEKPIVDYVQSLMKRLGMPVNKEGAENIVSNVGTYILKRKLAKSI